MALDRLSNITKSGLGSVYTYDVGGINATGVITATSFIGSGNFTAVDGTFTGNVSVGGTLTYEDVTNIDSVGLITARSGIHVTGGKVGIGTDSAIGHLDVRDASGSDPTISIHHSNADVEGECIRLARTDIPTIRYHSIKAKHGGGATANYIKFDIHNSSGGITDQSEILRLVGNGNVGIGTDDPQNTLHVKGPTGGVSARFTDAVNATVFVSHPSSGKSKIADAGGNYGFEFDTASVNVLSGGSERLRINSSGNINIASGGSLSVTDSNNNDSGQASTTGAINCNLIRPYNNSNSSWNGVYFLSRNAVGGGAKSVGIVETGLRVGSFSNDLSATERIKLSTDGTIISDYGTSDGNHVYFRNDEVGIFIGSWGTGSSYPRECTFNATRIDNGTLPFLRLAGQGGIKFAVDANTIRGSILNTGEFRIGTTDLTSVSTDKYHVIGDINIANNQTNLGRLTMQERTNVWISFKDGGGTHYGSISRNGSGVTYGSNSDYRLKNNVENFSGGIDLVKQLRPVTFNWNELSGNEDTTSTQRGFLAHEVQEVEPAAVSGEKDEMDRYGDCYDAEGRRTQINVFEHQAEDGETWTFTSEHIRDQQLDPAKLIPILTAALKESIARIESLEERISALEG